MFWLLSHEWCRVVVFELELQVRRRLLADKGSLVIVLFVSSKILWGFFRPGYVLARSEFTLTLRAARSEVHRRHQ